MKEPKKRLEKYSERFDNDESSIGNPETWNKRLICKDCHKLLEDCTCIEDTVDIKETLEEARLKYLENRYYKSTDSESFIAGAKWKEEQHRITTDDAYNEGFENGKHWYQERSYSEEEVYNFLLKYQKEYAYANNEIGLKYWFEQFKKK